MFNSEPKLGRPPIYTEDSLTEFRTQGGVLVNRQVLRVDDPVGKLDELAQALNDRRGCLFSSAYEYPGRYSRWSIGFVNPPLVFETWSGPRIKLTALNERGEILLEDFLQVIKNCAAVNQKSINVYDTFIEASILPVSKSFTEENRSKQNSVFSVIRSVLHMWQVKSEVDSQLGFYGAFGYDLAFQFNMIQLKQDRSGHERELVLYLPDEFLVC